MKKAFLIFFPIVVLAVVFVYMQKNNQKPTDIENSQKIPLEVKDNTVQDPQCHMFIVGKDYTVQVITSDNKTHFFDDPGCAVLWMDANGLNRKDVTMWFYTLDTKTWAKNVYFSIYDGTPMRYGFGAYEKQQKGFIDYEEMKLRMRRGENMTNPKIRKKILKGINK